MSMVGAFILTVLFCLDMYAAVYRAKRNDKLCYFNLAIGFALIGVIFALAMDGVING